jgi:hypothetical protein
VVVDDLWRHWGGVHIPAIQAALHRLDGHAPVFTAGRVAIYDVSEIAWEH